MNKIFLSAAVVACLFGCSQKLTDADKVKIDAICVKMAELDTSDDIGKKVTNYFAEAGVQPLPREKNKCVEVLSKSVLENYDIRENMLNKLTEAAHAAVRYVRDMKALNSLYN